MITLFNNREITFPTGVFIQVCYPMQELEINLRQTTYCIFILNPDMYITTKSPSPNEINPGCAGTTFP